MDKNLDSKIIKNRKVISIIANIVFLVSSLLTIIFSCMSLTNSVSAETCSIALRIMLSVIFLAFGIFMIVLGFVEPIEKRVYNFFSAGISLGFGIFFLLEAAATAINCIIGYLLPAIIACIGLTLLIKNILEVAKKEVDENQNIVIYFIVDALVIGLGLTSLILNLLQNEIMIKVTWLILGLIMFSLSVSSIVHIAKKNKKDKKVIEAKIEE